MAAGAAPGGGSRLYRALRADSRDRPGRWANAAVLSWLTGIVRRHHSAHHAGGGVPALARAVRASADVRRPYAPPADPPAWRRAVLQPRQRRICLQPSAARIELQGRPLGRVRAADV